MQFSKLLILCVGLMMTPYSNQLVAKEIPPTIIITGATDEPIESNVYMFCGKSTGLINGKNFQELEVTMLKNLFQFEIVLPLKTAIGKHKIIASHDYPKTRQTDVKVRFRDGKGINYKKQGAGEIEIKKIPQAEGEMFIAELSSKKRGNISIAVKINAKATNSIEIKANSLLECSRAIQTERPEAVRRLPVDSRRCERPITALPAPASAPLRSRHCQSDARHVRRGPRAGHVPRPGIPHRDL